MTKRIAIALMAFASWANAGTLQYTITDLGTLSGGAGSSGNAVSSNGLAAGSGDSASMNSQAFAWNPLSGISGIGPYNSASLWAFGLGINSSGVSVGYEVGGEISYRAFYNNGAGTAYIPLLSGGSSNSANGINDAGVIVGSSNTDTSPEVAFRYASGAVTSLGTLPGGGTSRADAINNAGTIAGQSDSGTDSNPHPAIYNGSWTDLSLLAGYQSGEATAISSDGRVTGTLYDGLGGSVAFLWTSGGGMIALGALTSGGSSSAFGINANGYVVGTSDGTAFLCTSGSVGPVDLNTLVLAPGWQLTSANAINDAGQIVGTGTYQGMQRGFLLNPTDVPEPAAGLLAGGGTMVLYSLKRRMAK